MKNFKAILFDFDGVLADTMEDNFTAWKEAFKSKNIKITRDDYFQLEGMQLKNLASTIGKKYKVDKDNYEYLVQFKNKYYLENHSFRFYSGVVELVNLLAENNIRLAIVSASNMERLEKTVSRNFLKKFDAIVSGDDTLQGKPHPDPYLTAMKKLGIFADQCIVVENSPLGIMSAKAAGTYCIAICSTLSREYLQEADEIIARFEELKKVLNIC